MIRRNYIEPEVFKTPVSTSGIFMASTYDSGNNGEGNDPNMSGNTGDLDDDDEAGANSWFLPRIPSISCRAGIFGDSGAVSYLFFLKRWRFQNNVVFLHSGNELRTKQHLY